MLLQGVKLKVFRRQRDMDRGDTPVVEIDLSSGHSSVRFETTRTSHATGFAQAYTLCCFQILTDEGVHQVIAKSVEDKIRFCKDLMESLAISAGDVHGVEGTCLLHGKVSRVEYRLYVVELLFSASVV